MSSACQPDGSLCLNQLFELPIPAETSSLRLVVTLLRVAGHHSQPVGCFSLALPWLLARLQGCQLRGQFALFDLKTGIRKYRKVKDRSGRSHEALPACREISRIVYLRAGCNIGKYCIV